MAKYVCLSFDDGPNNVAGDNTMNVMLDILEENGVPASFFLIGNKITEENKKVILRACSLGCDIQNHSWTHPAMAEMKENDIAEEYRKCDEAILKITGKKAEFFRPPYISVGQQMYEVIKVPFICGCGCNDWDPNFDADYRYNQMMKDAGNGTIFLLHVSEGNKATLDAVKRIIPVLKGQGYTFVNLPDLFKNCGVNQNIPNSLWSVANGPDGNTWPRG
ncbi:MAG: polysaccharide deacetylase family protein [Treponema sp.]|nr:polysaccharide deacetylase family protein [Treponema sp.]